MTKKIEALIGLLLLLLMPTIGCGSGSSSAVVESSNREALIQAFEGLDKIEKQEDKSWLLSWKPVVADDIIYAIYKSEDSGEFNYNKALATVSNSSNYIYLPTNIFTTEEACFVVRIAASVDENEKKLCTVPEGLEFQGIDKLVAQDDGGYLIEWPIIDLEGTFFTIYSKKKDGEYNFSQPSYAAITLNYQKTPTIERGVELCYIVRYTNNVLPEDTNTKELCTEPSTAIVFGGIGRIFSSQEDPALAPTSIKITWTPSPTADITHYRIYQVNSGSFNQIVMTVDKTKTEAIIENLVAGRQYSFGVRALDQFERIDKNIQILTVNIPD